MRCLSCHRLSWYTFCKDCQEKLLKPSITKRVIGSMDVYSFFLYRDIEDLLLTKHTPQGFKVYKALALFTFKPFMKNFILHYPRDIYIIGIDENVKSGYSHVALLTSSMRAKGIKVLHSSILAKNNVNYSGKTLEYRLKNPRNFYYNSLKEIDAILVDDIITTGTTLKEAKEILEENGVNVLFALTLANVKV